MATYTDNYQLIKPLYSETADIDAINDNMDKVDDIMHNSQISLADAYDQTQTYELGEKVMYEMLLYKCVSRIETPEVWNPDHWERTTAADEGGNYVDVDEKYQTGLNVADVDIDGDQHSIKVPYIEGATSQADGAGGLVPAPEAGDENKFLKGNGSWDDVPAGGSTVTITPETIAEPKAKVADYSIDGVSDSIYAPIIQIDGKASGAVASFSDGSANPIKSIDIGIVPLQSGSGDPSPNNNRPISGWSSVDVTRCGINLFDYNNYEDIDVTGTLTIRKGHIFPSGTYTIINNSNSDELYYKTVKDDKSSYSSTSQVIINNAKNVTISTGYLLYVYSSSELQNIFVGHGENQPYTAYNGTTYTIPFEDSQGDPLTIYGGEIHIRRVNGVWSGEVVNKYVKELMSNYTWTYSSGSGGYFRTTQVPTKKAGNSNVVSEVFLTSEQTSITYMEDKTIKGRDSDNALFIRYNDAQGDATVLNNAISGKYMCYEIDTPTTYPIDPANIPNIITLLGDNNMFADTGDIDEVIYIRDLNLAFNELWDLVHSNSGTRSLSLSKRATEEEEKKEEEKKEEPTEEEPKEEKR